MENYMAPLTEVLQQQKEKGYDKNFEFIDGSLKCEGTDKNYKPEDIVIEKVFRFEGDSDPADMSVLYNIQANDGTKGTLVDAYGTYDDDRLAQFLKGVEIKEDANR